MNAASSFREYVLRRRKLTNDACGDFIRDAREDPSFPDPQTFDELSNYLAEVDAVERAIAAAWVVWKEYVMVRDPVT